jgi:hypothetical protein
MQIHRRTAVVAKIKQTSETIGPHNLGQRRINFVTKWF